MNWIMRAAVSGLVVATTGGCHLPPTISDTGFRGTWSRGDERYLSIVSIACDDGRWLVRRTMRYKDETQSVVCDWDGRCQETIHGKPAATHTIAVRYDPAGKTLTVDTVEVREYPVKRTTRYSDVLEVADEGRTLRIYTTDRDGQHFEGRARPMRLFTKIADSVPYSSRGKRP